METITISFIALTAILAVATAVLAYLFFDKKSENDSVPEVAAAATGTLNFQVQSSLAAPEDDIENFGYASEFDNTALAGVVAGTVGGTHMSAPYLFKLDANNQIVNLGLVGEKTDRFVSAKSNNKGFLDVASGGTMHSFQWRSGRWQEVKNASDPTGFQALDYVDFSMAGENVTHRASFRGNTLRFDKFDGTQWVTTDTKEYNQDKSSTAIFAAQFVRTGADLGALLVGMTVPKSEVDPPVGENLQLALTRFTVNRANATWNQDLNFQRNLTYGLTGFDMFLTDDVRHLAIGYNRWMEVSGAQYHNRVLAVFKDPADYQFLLEAEQGLVPMYQDEFTKQPHVHVMPDVSVVVGIQAQSSTKGAYVAYRVAVPPTNSTDPLQLVANGGGTANSNPQAIEFTITDLSGQRGLQNLFSPTIAPVGSSRALFGTNQLNGKGRFVLWIDA